jgi:UPF0755 protein
MKKTVIFSFAGALLSYCLYVLIQLLTPLPAPNASTEILIPKGATFRQAIQVFSEAGLIQDKNLFISVGRVSRIDRKIRAGYYSVYPGMNALDLLRVLRKGQIIEFEVSVIEGDSLVEIGDKLSEKGIISKEHFQEITADKDFLVSYKIDAPSLEGYLFPDTYKIPKGMEPKEAIGMMINKLRKEYSEKLMERTAEIGMSEREVLTLASIIEKEAATDEERPLISAVYHNRLRKKMPLQADPTAIYGVKSSREKITSEDLKRKTSYNTYVIKGLPPGPIASTSTKSIIAALYPADVQFIYFVSNNDGTHHFSVTAAEHAAAVRAYREKKQAEDDQEQENTDEES